MMQKSSGGAHASRVLPAASRRRIVNTILAHRSVCEKWSDEVCGETPQTTRRRRVLPFFYYIVPAWFLVLFKFFLGRSPICRFGPAMYIAGTATATNADTKFAQ